MSRLSCPRLPLSNQRLFALLQFIGSTASVGLSEHVLFAEGGIAPMQQAQLLLVAGFVMLGWVMVRRQIRLRRRVGQNLRAADKAVQAIRNHKEPSMPLAGAPVETQRWQAAMFDLQRELKADLDTRIMIVQTLLQQVDQRIERLEELQSSLGQRSPR